MRCEGYSNLNLILTLIVIPGAVRGASTRLESNRLSRSRSRSRSTRLESNRLSPSASVIQGGFRGLKERLEVKYPGRRMRSPAAMAREEARARELGASYDEGRAAAREASA